MKQFAATIAVGLVCSFVPGGPGITAAQELGHSSRQILQQVPSSVVGRDVVTALHTYDGLVTDPKHVHPGDITLYVLDGTVRLLQDGKPVQTLTAGQTAFVPAGMAHHVESQSTARILATYFVQSGETISQSAP